MPRIQSLFFAEWAFSWLVNYVINGRGSRAFPNYNFAVGLLWTASISALPVGGLGLVVTCVAMV